MNNIIALSGMVLMSMSATPNNLNNPQQHNFPTFDNVIAEAIVDRCVTCKGSEEIDLSQIVFIEEEAPVILGFDTADYLPEDFNPYKVYVDLDAIEFIEEDEAQLSLDTTEWLPENFDPYATPTDINSISYMEDEEDFFPLINTSEWLPEGFDPYAKTTKDDCPSVHDHSMSAR
jgi:hypothetical protein